MRVFRFNTFFQGDFTVQPGLTIYDALRLYRIGLGLSLISFSAHALWTLHKLDLSVAAILQSGDVVVMMYCVLVALQLMVGICLAVGQPAAIIALSGAVLLVMQSFLMPTGTVTFLLVWVMAGLLLMLWVLDRRMYQDPMIMRRSRMIERQ